MMIYRVKRFCNTPALRVQGMKNDTLEPDECCVFAYPKENYLSFWMLDTPQDLAILFGMGNLVSGTHKMFAYDKTQITSESLANIAIEFPADGFPYDVQHYAISVCNDERFVAVW